MRLLHTAKDEDRKLMLCNALQKLDELSTINEFEVTKMDELSTINEFEVTNSNSKDRDDNFSVSGSSKSRSIRRQHSESAIIPALVDLTSPLANKVRGLL